MTDVVVVDDHELVADGLRRLVEQAPTMKVVQVCHSGDDLISYLAAGNHVDLCTLDLLVPGVSGLELLRTLGRRWPDVQVLVCTASANADVAARCLREGASGFISKFRPGSEFTRALRQVANGGRYIDEELMGDVVAKLAGRAGAERLHEGLSSREYEVLLALARGVSVKEIAESLFLSPKTVSTYRTRVLAKLNVSSNAELTAYALRNGLIELHTV
jgi:two-component system, NarL family, invasion response regulator UvrY